VIFFNLIMGVIGSFQYFTQAYIMTQGGPEDSTQFYALYLFNRAWRYLDMGYASAMGWILFVIVMVFTGLIFRSHHRWVHYGD
jgi:ABC-type sugar transport system permease subunit